MIKYRLACKNCELIFDSWFASSKEYEKLKKKSYLNCIRCNSNKVAKTLMAPRLINKSKFKKLGNQDLKFKKVSNKIKEYQKFIKNNFDFVGKNFAYEARSIHYDRKKNNKGIYGTATKEEIKELKEEGIKADLIPWVEDKSN
ncbi:DUF1178 family protein [Candidatus Pelagibacter sp.]|nr:DUF1178 family protein [Candidatus Pelagibacter sp.]